jgi:hypothetical protein
VSCVDTGSLVISLSQFITDPCVGSAIACSLAGPPGIYTKTQDCSGDNGADDGADQCASVETVERVVGLWGCGRAATLWAVCGRGGLSRIGAWRSLRRFSIYRGFGVAAR